jgi:flavin reductase (DIM6/NTAB) family NADH-FMN oxidoreductase RutF
MTAASQDITDTPFIDAMRRVPTAVSVITTDGRAGRFGVTVSAVASVSAEPRMLLVCISRRSPACAAIRENRIFTVNFLLESQSHVADCFAGGGVPRCRKMADGRIPGVHGSCRGGAGAAGMACGDRRYCRNAVNHRFGRQLDTES